jgi:hypothetical protein
MGKRIWALIASAALVSTSVGAYAAPGAAWISNIDGKVLVNRGDGFKPLLETASLSVGDRIMVGKDGSATVRYLASKCEVALTATSMTTIDEMGPCAGTGGGIFGATIIPAQGEGGSLSDGEIAALLLAAAAVVGGVVCLAVCDGKDKPASP